MAFSGRLPLTLLFLAQEEEETLHLRSRCRVIDILLCHHLHFLDKLLVRYFKPVLQSTLALRTPRYYGHPVNADKSLLPGEKHKEMNEASPCYYGLSLLRKWGHFPTPKCDLSRVFSRCNGHLSISLKIPDWRNKKRHYDKSANTRISCMQPDHF